MDNHCNLRRHVDKINKPARRGAPAGEGGEQRGSGSERRGKKNRGTVWADHEGIADVLDVCWVLRRVAEGGAHGPHLLGEWWVGKRTSFTLVVAKTLHLAQDVLNPYPHFSRPMAREFFFCSCKPLRENFLIFPHLEEGVGGGGPGGGGGVQHHWHYQFSN